MTSNDKKRAIKAARCRVNKDITAFASRGGQFSGALSGEGYNGGYRDAIDDLLLLIDSNTMPRRNGWWE